MSINAENVKINMNETIELPLDNGDVITLRTHIDGATREALVDFMARNVFDGISYSPSRKAPLKWMAFVQGFVIDDTEILMPTDGESADPYMVYALVKQLGIPDGLAKSAECAMIADTLAEMSIEADMKIQFLIDRAHADVAGGAANVAIQSVEGLNEFLRRGSEMMDMLGGVVQEYMKQLPSTLPEVPNER